jgi:cytochrome c553
MYPFALPEALGGAQTVSDVAEYIARLPMSADNGKGPGTDLDHGKQLYADNCVRCHGAQGEGDADKNYPRLQGQHYAYMVRQFDEIKSGKRRNANPEMVQQIQGFSEKDAQAVLDHASRLAPPADRIAPPGWKNPDFQ